MNRIRTIIVGTGGFGRYHMRVMANMPRSTELVGFVEPSEASRAATRELLASKGIDCPPFYMTIRELVAAQGTADAALICTPHKFHLENATDCLRNGMDVCVEKPMVMNASEARRLIALRNRTGRLVMVAFPGSLSPAILKAKQLLAQGAIGEVNAISAYVHQGWKASTAGTWRQVPDISGGGFLFDTGSHMINTVVELMGSNVASVTAMMDNRGAPVEINASVSGRTANGTMFSLSGAGDCVQCCSQVLVFGNRGILRTGVWGEFLTIKKTGKGDFQPVPYKKSRGAWEQFLRVRAGKLENPCPAEVGLRFALLMDMIRRSVETGCAVSSKGPFRV